MRRLVVLPLLALALAACDVGRTPEPTTTLSMTAAPTSPPPAAGTTVSGVYLAATSLFRGTPTTTSYAFEVSTRIVLSGPGGRTEVSGTGVAARTETGVSMRTTFRLSGEGPDVPYRSVLVPEGLYLQGAPGVPGDDEAAFVLVPPQVTTATAKRLRSRYGSTDGYDPEVQRKVLLALDAVDVLPDAEVGGVPVHQFRHVTRGTDVTGPDVGLAGQVRGLTVTTTTSVDDHGRVVQLSSGTTGRIEGRDLVQSQVLGFSDYGAPVDTGLPAGARVVPLPAP